MAVVLARAEARIDLGRLASNFRAVAAFAGKPVLGVVKADAYGHGAATVARVLEREGAPMLAVAYPDEGVALRNAGLTIPVLVLAG